MLSAIFAIYFEVIVLNSEWFVALRFCIEFLMVLVSMDRLGHLIFDGFRGFGLIGWD